MSVTTASRIVGLRSLWAARAWVGVAVSIAGLVCAADVEGAAPSLRPGAAMPADCGFGFAPFSPARLPDGTRGVLIASILPDSPAAEAGLKLHDIVIRYDGQEVDSPEQLLQRVRDDRPGRDVVVTLLRAGRLLEPKMTLRPAVPAPVVRDPRLDSDREQPYRFQFVLPHSMHDWLDPGMRAFRALPVNL